VLLCISTDRHVGEELAHVHVLLEVSAPGSGDARGARLLCQLATKRTTNQGAREGQRSNYSPSPRRTPHDMEQLILQEKG
jgi:hypothetical protein